MKKKAKSKSRARTYASLKKKIQRWIEEAQEKLMLEAWTIEITWSLDKKEKIGAITLMNTVSLSPHLSAHITVYLGSCFQCSSKHVRRICYHELLHARISAFADLAGARCITKEQLRDTEEELVETLAAIIAG